MTESRITVLCVGPPDVRSDIVDAIVAADGMDAVDATDIDEARSVSGDRPVDCVVSPYNLGESTGMDLFEALRDDHPGIACILYTDMAVSDLGSDAFDEIVEYLPRDVENASERLVDLVRSVVTEHMQVGFPIPEDEDDRLAAVDDYDVAGMGTAETFDRLTTLIRNHFDVDVAFVGLVNANEEKFLSCTGADWATLSREDSVCTYAMLEDAVTVIEDVQADPRFEHNDRLRELGVSAYAGANLSTPDGHVLGELCLIDDEPRSFTDAELADLQLFADEIMEQLELRRRLPASDAALSGGE